MFTAGEIGVELTAGLGGLERGLRSAGEKIDSFAERAQRPLLSVGDAAQRLGASLQDLGGRLTRQLSVPIGLAAGGALRAAGQLQQMQLGLEAMLGSAGAAADELGRLREAAEAPGLSFDQAIQGSLNLQAVGFSAESARRTLSELGNALALSGGSADDLAEVTRQLSQIQSLGKITAENFNVIRERVPLVGRAMQQAFGTTSIEALRETGIGTTEFIERLVEGLSTLERAQGGISNAFINLGVAIKTGAAELGLLADEYFGITGIIEGVTDVISGAVSAFKRLPEPLQKVTLGLGGIAFAIGPVLAGLGSLLIGFGALAKAAFLIRGLKALSGVLSTLASGFGGLTGVARAAAGVLQSTGSAIAGFFGGTATGAGVLSSSLAAAGSSLVAFTGVVGGLAAAAVLLYRNWDDVVAFFTTGGGAKVGQAVKDTWEDAKKAVLTAIEGITRGITSLNEAFGTVATGVEENVDFSFFGAKIADGLDFILTSVRNVVRTAGDLFGGLASAMGGTAKTIAQILTGDFGGAFDTFVEGVKRGVGVVVRSFAGLTAVVLQAVETTTSFFGADFAGLERAQQDVEEFARSFSLLGDEAEAGAARVTAAFAGVRAGDYLQDPGWGAAAAEQFRVVEAEAAAGMAKAAAAAAKALRETLASTLSDTRAAVREIDLGEQFFGTDALSAAISRVGALREGWKESVIEAGNVTNAVSRQIKASLEAAQESLSGLIGALPTESIRLAPIEALEAPEAEQSFGLDGSALQIDTDGIAAGWEELADRIGVSIAEIKAHGLDGATALAETRDRFGQVATEIGAALESGLATGITAFAEGIGELAVSGVTLEGAGQLILGTLADMAVRVGQVAVGVALAVSGIKAALKTLNPFAALAAGIALIALGKAVGSALSRAAETGGGGGLASYGGSPAQLAPPPPPEYSQGRSLSAAQREMQTRPVAVDVRVEDTVIEGENLRLVYGKAVQLRNA